MAQYCIGWKLRENLLWKANKRFKVLENVIFKNHKTSYTRIGVRKLLLIVHT